MLLAPRLSWDGAAAAVVLVSEVLFVSTAPLMAHVHPFVHLFYVPDPANSFTASLINLCKGIRLSADGFSSPWKIHLPPPPSCLPLCSFPLFLQTNLQVQMQDEEVDKHKRPWRAQRSQRILWHASGLKHRLQLANRYQHGMQGLQLYAQRGIHRKRHLNTPSWLQL